MLSYCSITGVMSLRTEKIKKVAGKIREARRYWDAHRNKAARRERDLALELYSELTEEEKKEILVKMILVHFDYRITVDPVLCQRGFLDSRAHLINMECWIAVQF